MGELNNLVPRVFPYSAAEVREREDPGNEILKRRSKSIVIRTLPLLRLYGLLND